MVAISLASRVRECPHGNACGVAGLVTGWFCRFDCRGRGLILVPALFATFPAAHPATLFGTNKEHRSGAPASRPCNTAAACRCVGRPWLRRRRFALPPAWGRGWSRSLPPDLLRKALPGLLLVLGYTLAKKDLGRHHAPRFHGTREVLVTIAIAAAIGFLRWLLRPGTGSFSSFCWCVCWVTTSSAPRPGPLLNTASNLAAIALFAWKGHVWWHYVVAMAVANILGSLAGTHLALKHGTGFVRGVFIGVTALILKTGYDAFLR